MCIRLLERSNALVLPIRVFIPPLKVFNLFCKGWKCWLKVSCLLITWLPTNMVPIFHLYIYVVSRNNLFSFTIRWWLSFILSSYFIDGVLLLSLHQSLGVPMGSHCGVVSVLCHDGVACRWENCCVDTHQLRYCSIGNPALLVSAWNRIYPNLLLLVLNYLPE